MASSNKGTGHEGGAGAAAGPPVVLRYAAPSTVSQSVEEELVEAERALQCVEAQLNAGHLADAIAMLRVPHDRLLHLGKLADIQTIHHGVPRLDDPRPPLVLTPLENSLQAFMQMMSASALDPAWTEAQLAALGAANRPTASASGALGVPASAAPFPMKQEPGLAARGPPRVTFGVPSVAAAASSALVGGDNAPSAGATVDNALIGGAEVGAALALLSSQTAAAHSTGPASSAPPAAAAAANPKLAASGTKWSVAEVDLFEKGVAQFSHHAPAKIAALVGTRSAEQVRERIRTAKRKLQKAVAGGGAPAPVAAAAATVVSAARPPPGAADVMDDGVL